MLEKWELSRSLVLSWKSAGLVELFLFIVKIYEIGSSVLPKKKKMYGINLNEWIICFIIDVRNLMD